MNIPAKIDRISGAVLCFIAGMLAGGYFLGSVADVVLFALVCSLCGSELYLRMLSGGKPKLSEADKRVRELFVYNDDGFALDFFARALSARHAVERREGLLLVDGTALLCRVKPVPLDADVLVDMLGSARRQGLSRAVVICDAFTPAAASAAARVPGIRARLLAFNDALRLMRATDSLPAVPAEKRRRGAFVRSLVGANRVRGYLLCALTLAIFSRLTSLSVYYLAAAALSLTLAILSRFLPRGKEKDG